MTNHKYRCPVCGAKSFEVTAHVTQDWKIDCNGTFLEALNSALRSRTILTKRISGAVPTVIFPQKANRFS